MIRSVIAAIKNSYKPLCKQERKGGGLTGMHNTLTDFEFIRLQNLSIFGLFMKCGSKYFLRSFDKDGHSNR
jgi:hypothetical protein